jgi:outer membrane protein assembly factor BamE (lipoprotein component of BamABCDE complex)
MNNGVLTMDKSDGPVGNSGCFKALGIFFAIGLFVIGLLVAYEYSTRISKAQVQQLRYDMTRQEVIDVLGEPHQLVTGDPEGDWYYWCDYPTLLSDPLYIGFDPDGRVNWVSR